MMKLNMSWNFLQHALCFTDAPFIDFYFVFVMTFMHLGDEKISLRWTILLPAFVLVPYLLFIIISEAGHAYLML